MRKDFLLCVYTYDVQKLHGVHTYRTVPTVPQYAILEQYVIVIVQK